MTHSELHELDVPLATVIDMGASHIGSHTPTLSVTGTSISSLGFSSLGWVCCLKHAGHPSIGA